MLTGNTGHFKATAGIRVKLWMICLLGFVATLASVDDTPNGAIELGIPLICIGIFNVLSATLLSLDRISAGWGWGYSILGTALLGIGTYSVGILSVSGMPERHLFVWSSRISFIGIILICLGIFISLKSILLGARSRVSSLLNLALYMALSGVGVLSIGMFSFGIHTLVQTVGAKWAYGIFWVPYAAGLIVEYNSANKEQ
jgi:hypothetical protein